MSKRKPGKAQKRRELKEEYLPSGDQRSLRIEDLDLDAAVRRAAAYEDEVLLPSQEEEVEEVLQTFDEVVETEKELLKLFNPDRLNLEVVYNGKHLKFKIRNVEPTDDLKALQMDLSIYTDLSELEKGVMDKGGAGEKLSSSEERLYKNTVRKLENKLAGTILNQVHTILAYYVTPPTGTFDERVEFWKNVPFDLRTFIASETMDRLGISPDSDIKLFHAS